MRSPLLILLLLALVGCASQSDLTRVSQVLESRVDAVTADVESMKKAAADNEDTGKFVRKRVADISDNLTGLRTELQQLRGSIEELQVRVASLESDSKKETPGSVRDAVADIAGRLQYIENYLGLMEKKEIPGGVQGYEVSGSLKEEVDKEKSYSEALKTFKEGRYTEARQQFQDFLGAFPDTEYSDNAQFWIGECFYFDGKYEKAILEYEKVVQNYPKGNKVPDALLKQALSFMKLGDTTSAKLLLQRVINDYPNTTSARRAREELLSIKES